MAEAPRHAPIVLVASGLDPSGGAGFILDQRVIAAAGAWGCGVITALTVQDTGGARRCEPVGVELVGEQLPALLSDYELAAVKIGLVPTVAIAEVVAAALEQTDAPVVWDPIFGASAGAGLLHGDPLEIADRLARGCELITPNLVEAGVLVARRIGDRASMKVAALELAGRYSCAVLVKGGHLEGDAVDILARDGAALELRSPRLQVGSVRGTGCFLSSTIAAGLARGVELSAAVSAAKRALEARLPTAIALGRGASVLV